MIQALPPAMAGVGERPAGYVREVLDGCLAHLRPVAAHDKGKAK